MKQLRRSFAPLIPELEEAACLLDAAVDAYLQDEMLEAQDLIVRADMPAIFDFRAPIIGDIDMSIHWQEFRPPKPNTPHKKAIARMPNAKTERFVIQRDGWHCRFCETKVINPKARKKLTELFPSQARWGGSNASKHTALSALLCSMDHVLPHSRGGDNEADNVVTACRICQFGRGEWTLEEVGFEDPRDYPPIVDNWDGLTRLLK